MTQTTFSPGPWRIDPASSDETTYAIQDAKDFHVAFYIENKADAHLIVAARDLLEMWEEALEALNIIPRHILQDRVIKDGKVVTPKRTSYDVAESLRAVIAKATKGGAK